MEYEIKDYLTDPDDWFIQKEEDKTIVWVGSKDRGERMIELLKKEAKEKQWE